MGCPAKEKREEEQLFSVTYEYEKIKNEYKIISSYTTS